MSRDDRVRAIARDLKRTATVVKIKRAALEAADAIVRKSQSRRTRLTICVNGRPTLRVHVIVQKPFP
jgi:hypothetical protein